MDKPLHVRVAEVLGWFRFEPSLNGMWPDEWRGQPPTPIVGEAAKEIPRYDTDWSATGPLIEKYGITLMKAWPDSPDPWHACTESHYGAFNVGHSHQCEFINAGLQTPLVAVCNLILALAEAGKLEAA